MFILTAFFTKFKLTLKNLLRPISLNNTRAICITATAGTEISLHSIPLVLSHYFHTSKSYLQYDVLLTQILTRSDPYNPLSTILRYCHLLMLGPYFSSNVVVHSPKSTINHRYGNL